MLGLRSLRAATSVAKTTNVPSVSAVQQFRFRVQLPAYLKGKLYWKRKDLRGKKDPDREKKERDLRILRVASTQFHWKPQTEIEKMYQQVILECYKTTKRHGVRTLYELLDLVKEKEDLQFAFRFFRIMSNRNLKFKQDTARRLVDALLPFEEYSSIIELMKNRTVLRLPVDTETAQYVLEKLFEREELAEQTIEVIQSFTKGKVRPFVAAQYDYLTTKLDSAQIARLYTDFAPHDVQLLQPSSYEAILNATGESEQLEKILKRIEIELSVAQRNEEHNQVLRNVKDKLANLPVKESVQEEAEQA